MYKFFINLKGDLDSLLCAYYGINSCEEKRFRGRFDNIPMTHVFYNNAKMRNPPSPGGRFKKYFTEYEHKYIKTFVSRFTEYLDNLERVIGTTPSMFAGENRRSVRSIINTVRRKLKIDIKDM